MEKSLDKLLQLALKYGALAFDALGTFVAAKAGTLTEEEVEAEVVRIQKREAADFAADWAKVNS